MKSAFQIILVLLSLTPSLVASDSLFVETEGFSNHGGWKIDTQSIPAIGSPYLLAHGWGKPVKNATTTVTFPSTGKYHIWVRTKDWVARWKAKGHPGRFQILVEGKLLATTFGTEGAKWHWQDGGEITINDNNKKISLALHDLTGFDGRCDAIYFTKEKNGKPPEESKELYAWRMKQLNLPAKTPTTKQYDLVVVGGGYSGLGAAISAARMGCKVALVQDRPVLGGNGSNEVRVWAQGLIRRGKFPRIGEIVTEFSPQSTNPKGYNSNDATYGDDLKKKLVDAEKNIDLFLNHYVYTGTTKKGKLISVTAMETRTNARRRFQGKYFCDATGHGVVGHLARAKFEMLAKGRMGMSNLWVWKNNKQPVSFPTVPWALQMEMKDFPYPHDFHGEWYWESGFDKDPIKDAEGIRDWNLRAVFGAFNAMKNGDGADKHKNAELAWVAYIGGPRESRRLIGDVLLTKEDIVTKRDFPDGTVPSTWAIDLHYPKKRYAKKFPNNPFISKAKFGGGVDRYYGYPLPYRSFYSQNISNLFMAGRCISVTHEALGTVRVMRTCGMMGEVVGKAAAVCTYYNCTPRDVYKKHWKEMEKLLKLPGVARRDSVDGKIIIGENALALAPSLGLPPGLNPKKLPGIVIDDRQAKKTGKWVKGRGLKGYVSFGYLYSSRGSNATIQFDVKIPKSGIYDVRLAIHPHENRGSKVPVTLKSINSTTTKMFDMKTKRDLKNGFASFGKAAFQKGETVSIIISAKEANGMAHADAIQLLPVN
ncbi:FIG00406056: hypothetical protein [hydrothermal vent metagenome]|uniref:Golvesin/Xly CBD-like domain-containing protein n=1 Tax=hydrothermal vent metagenome TaxID=652676 RepID=A0A3B1DIT4_9ZZZZ